MRPNDRSRSDSFNLSQNELPMISNQQMSIVCKRLKVSSCRDRLAAGDDIIIRPLSQHDDKWAPGQSIRPCCIFHHSSVCKMKAGLNEAVHLTMDDNPLVEDEKISTILVPWRCGFLLSSLRPRHPILGRGLMKLRSLANLAKEYRLFWYL